MTAPDEGLFGVPQSGGMATYEPMAQAPLPQQGVTHQALAPQETNPVDVLGDFEDYWGFERFHTFVMPDGKQTITFKTLTEGDIGLFSKKLKRDVVVEKRSGDARFRMDQSEERRALIEVAVTGWTLRRRGRNGWELTPFNNSPGGTLAQWLNKADPEIVADLERSIRKENPALVSTGPETLEAIDKQVEELLEQRKEIEARQRGEGSSATR